MTKAYPLSKSLKKSIEAVFHENVDTGWLALGLIGLPPECRERALSKSIPLHERIRLLCERIEEWIELHGDEIEEFDSEYDTTRIQSETRALLLVLRELANFFPDVVGFQNSSEADSGPKIDVEGDNHGETRNKNHRLSEQLLEQGQIWAKTNLDSLDPVWKNCW